MQDVKDNHEEAAKMAPQTLQLCQMVSAYFFCVLMFCQDSCQCVISLLLTRPANPEALPDDALLLISV
jgi:hypothetical protein